MSIHIKSVFCFKHLSASMCHVSIFIGWLSAISEMVFGVSCAWCWSLFYSNLDGVRESEREGNHLYSFQFRLWDDLSRISIFHQKTFPYYQNTNGGEGRGRGARFMYSAFQMQTHFKILNETCNFITRSICYFVTCNMIWEISDTEYSLKSGLKSINLM